MRRNRSPAPSARNSRQTLVILVALMGLQLLAAAFFVIDGFEDWIGVGTTGNSLDLAMEILIALALFTGVALSSRSILRLTKELSRKDQLLARARGAINDHIQHRFRDWGLTKGESDVALFALKGCDVSEIAAMRNKATGTIRSQLSQVYTKAGVNSQAMLLSVFLDDLIDIPGSNPD